MLVRNAKRNVGSEEQAENRRKRWAKVLSWVEKNQLAEKEEYEHKLEELQKICTPIMTKLHTAGNTGQGPSPGSRQGPTVEEVD